MLSGTEDDAFLAAEASSIWRDAVHLAAVYLYIFASLHPVS